MSQNQLKGLCKTLKDVGHRIETNAENMSVGSDLNTILTDIKKSIKNIDARLERFDKGIITRVVYSTCLGPNDKITWINVIEVIQVIKVIAPRGTD